MQPDHRRDTDDEARDNTARSEIAAMVLTRLPLLAGPTDGERFSGRRERVVETDERVLERLKTLQQRER